jgi:HEAT repeat protein
MALLSGRRIRLIGGLLALLLLAGGAIGWLQREPLLTWYNLRGLKHASDSDAPTWIQRVASQGELAVAGLLQCMSHDDEPLCARARAALERIGSGLPQSELGWSRYTERIATAFPRLSVSGQRSLMGLTANWLQPAAQPSPAAIAFGGRMLNLSGSAPDATIRSSALDIAGALLAGHPDSDVLGHCRALALACLKDADAHNRTRAVHLALCPALEILTDVAPLVRDPEADVRRAAILAVGNSRMAISDERLATALHDPDSEVRRLCEKALLGRGLSRRHLQLARLITDSRPATRLQVIFYLHQVNDLDVAVWLRLLTQDPAEAVRLAAVRAAAELAVAELHDRLEEMATGDPNPTVSAWAKYYSRILKERQASIGAP